MSCRTCSALEGVTARALALGLLALLASPTGALAAGAPASDHAGNAATTAPEDAAGSIPPVSIPPTLADCKDPMCWISTAPSSSSVAVQIDAKHNQIAVSNFEAVDTTRGLAYIRADQLSASGIGTGKQVTLGNSRWMLSGHVLAEMKQGRLAADSATVKLDHNSIASIVATGHPARFEHIASATAPAGGAAAGAASAAPGTPLGLNVNVHGHADSISYDVGQGRVQLSGDAWLSDGCNEITSARIVYDAMTQNVQAGAAPGGSQRVHGTLRTTRPGSNCAGGIAQR